MLIAAQLSGEYSSLRTSKVLRPHQAHKGGASEVFGGVPVYETRRGPFSFHSTYILDSLPYGHSAFRKGFPVKFIQAEIYGILVFKKLRFCPFKALW
ncbi:hypothetical protein TWF481_000390 [Arthrobotrys musiformis]|uniref:Uncharacterized protein n=1 Tax=Arthrobotrys musiformis TaxID=47236 RepID=A0AAV9WND1_9PEZI